MIGKMRKSLVGMLLTLIMLLMLGTSCLAANDRVLTETQIDSFKSSAVQLIEQITAFTDEEIEQYLAQNDAFTNSALNSWTGARDELGAYQEVGDQEVEVDGNNVIITSDVTFEDKTASVELIADLSEGTLTSMAFNVNYTLGEKMAQAAMNTVLGLGVVFLILFFLCFIIGLFKYVKPLEERFSKKEEEPEDQAPVPAPVPIVEEEASDDEELVAVIAAAIAAYEGTSTDGFVVRSIRKSSGNKWKRS
ncbi:MAG TPA: OadG family protein [Candidatus Limivivens merdigallinarum]|uniref:OadG family protein n=1 Tax=Candidatus Limivivens merdigallinarum TaxID=2840859 RepID=A0A9D0ZZS4_9FIRM|nr:OadG family protein [Candidatus Limivivens merdigallinarum]